MALKLEIQTLTPLVPIPWMPNPDQLHYMPSLCSHVSIHKPTLLAGYLDLVILLLLLMSLVQEKGGTILLPTTSHGGNHCVWCQLGTR